MEHKKKTPEVRFAGFADEWEQRKLGELCDLLTGFPFESKQFTSNGVPLVRGMNVKRGYLDMSDDICVYWPSIVGYKPYLLQEDDVVIQMDGALIGRSYAKVGSKNVPSLLVQRVTRVRSKLADSDFIYQCIQRGFLRYIKGLKTETAVPHLSLKDIQEYDIPLPEYTEQQQIGTFFRHLDHLITLHQCKYEKLVVLKKCMLEKMFPKNGGKIPEIRFTGFTGDWEQRKVSEYGEFYYGHSAPKWSVTKDADTPCVRYGELYTKFGAKIDKIYSYTSIPPENLKFSNGTEVLIPRVGEDPMDYNHCTWLSLKDVAIGEMISVYNTEQNPLFTAIMFNATLREEFAKRVEGGSVTNLYFEKLKDIDVSFPTLEEQEKIATYFDHLDHLITLHQRKLERLKTIKKSLLEKMFV